MEMLIDFPGGARVDAHFGPYTVMTDQPPAGGGSASAPAPYSLFLASIGTCAGIYVKSFCDNRNIPTEGIRIIQTADYDKETGLPTNIELEIILPSDFPEKYIASVIHVAELCKVKKTIMKQPAFKITTSRK